MGRKRGELLAEVLMVAGRAGLGLPAIQHDGLESMPAVVAAILEEGHSIRIIGKPGRTR